MAEPVMPRPRVALVYGDSARAEHLREALDARVDIVYASTAAGFDVERLADRNVSAVVVNLDGGDWLEPIVDRLEAAGVPVVFNDPAISRTLDGWARARWLRNLTAKLTGFGDCDPPRPAAPVRTAGTSETGVVAASAGATAVAEVLAVASGETGLRSARLEAALDGVDAIAAVAPPERLAAIPDTALRGTNEGAAVAVQCGPVTVPTEGHVEVGGAAATALAKDGEGDMIESVEDAPDAGGEAKPAPEATAAEAHGSDVRPGVRSVAPPDDRGAELLELDPDTAALSALIDRQLAESVSQTPTGAPQVWRVAQGGAVSAVELAKFDAPGGDAGAEPADRPAAAVESRRAHPVSKPVEEVEVLKGLPALDDWQLVDPGAPTAADSVPASPEKRTQAAIDIAGLELVPMEEVAAVDRHNDPIEHWMDTAERVAADAARRRRSGGEGAT